jgi:hypothetical protein
MVERDECKMEMGSSRPRRCIVFVYANTGQGHKSAADALAESITRHSHEAGTSVVRMEHLDIYRLGEVPLFRRAAQHYRMLCRHARWLYDLMFRITDNPVAKRLITKVIVRLYGRRIERAIIDLNPDVIVILHPLFVSDVLCEIRRRSGHRWRLVSLITDLGVAHSGWTSRALDSALFVYPGLIGKLRSQRSLPPDSKVAVTRAPIRRAFAEPDRLQDKEQLEALALTAPYVLYIPGLQPRGAVVRQVEHLAGDNKGIPIVIAGPVPAGSIRRLEKARYRVLHLPSLSSTAMAATMRNAEVVAGKAGPTVMAEAATTDVPFVPTAELGFQETGNSRIGRLLYGADSMPWWAEKVRRDLKHYASAQESHASKTIMEDAEIYDLLTTGTAHLDAMPLSLG